MEPHRRPHRITDPGHRRQAGITALGFLTLAIVFGIVGLAALKITPLYLEGVRVKAVLDDLKEEQDGKGTTANNLRLDLASRLYVEGVTLHPDALKITPGGNGYTVHVQYDNRTRFLADVWFLIVVDEQIEIQR